jgi:hypothetical protein
MTTRTTPYLTSAQQAHDARLAARSKYTYVRALVRLIIWLSVSAPNVFSPVFIEEASFHCGGFEHLNAQFLARSLSVANRTPAEFPFDLEEGSAWNVGTFEDFLTNQRTRNGNNLDPTTMGSYRSALYHLYEMHRVCYVASLLRLFLTAVSAQASDCV